MAPVLLLLVIAPLVAEFLLGDVTLASLPALVLFIPLYGGGAVLIREVVRRGGGGWPAIVVFAAAYGVVEEGLATQSLFNPDYAHQHLLSSGFIPFLPGRYSGVAACAARMDRRHLRSSRGHHPGSGAMDSHRNRKHADLLADRSGGGAQRHKVVASPRLG